MEHSATHLECEISTLHGSSIILSSNLDAEGVSGPIDFDMVNDLFGNMSVMHPTMDNTSDLPPLAQQWIYKASPAAQEKVEKYNLTLLSQRKCCSAGCMGHLTIGCLRACWLHYHTMSQQAARQWLNTILKNQPQGCKLFYIFSTVYCLLSLLWLRWPNSIAEGVQEGIPSSLWIFW